MGIFYASKDSNVSAREKEHQELVRKLSAECMVVLENDGCLPLSDDCNKIALYGNGARHTIKGGTGSGDVNTRENISIEQGLINAGIKITSISWLNQYDQLVNEAKNEHNIRIQVIAEQQKIPVMMLMLGMPFIEPAASYITEDDIKESDTDTAVYVLSRNSGEGKDRQQIDGDYLLYPQEVANIKFLSEHYKTCIVLLNTGGIIDINPLLSIKGINAIVLTGQLGSTGGYAIADVLYGRSIPSGKLSDTWAIKYDDYPSAKTFGSNNKNIDDEYYEEGIYVGYRYFDTFNIEPAYPFGYGKGYTEFSISTINIEADNNNVICEAEVRNTGTKHSGKEVVQIYYSAPAGGVEKPYQELVAFGKTKLLAPGETQKLIISFNIASMASYSQNEEAWILEKGSYYIRVGNSSRNTKIEAVLIIDQTVKTVQVKNVFDIEDTLKEITSKGIKPYTYKREQEEKESAKQIFIDAAKIVMEEAVYQTGRPILKDEYPDTILTIEDVLNKTASIENLVAQLKIDEMADLCVGSSRGGFSLTGVIGAASSVVPGAAGDTTSALIKTRKIENLIMADGPAGLRLYPHFITTSDGTLLQGGQVFGGETLPFTDDIPEDAINYYQYCTAIPIATSLAQSWDVELIETIGKIVGREMKELHVHLWLAPGMNIHRNPLCGRNFEYYSEDPLLTGLCAAADTKGVQSFKGQGTTIKHFAANNQEDNRMFNNAHISERTLREIYLKGFEIAVRQSQPLSVMTSYNLINGTHAANHYALLQSVLRDEWGFEGVVMTDWFTSQDTSFLGSKSDKYPWSSSVLCIKAGNDIQMPGCQQNVDDIIEAVNNNEITLGDLQFCAANILKIIVQCQEVRI